VQRELTGIRSITGEGLFIIYPLYADDPFVRKRLLSGEDKDGCSVTDIRGCPGDGFTPFHGNPCCCWSQWRDDLFLVRFAIDQVNIISFAWIIL
jgi:hypothetical protein